MQKDQAAARSRWAGKKIIFVTGKGGVGKSLVAAAIAQGEARAGRSVLLTEIGDSSYYQDFWGLKKVNHEPQHLPQGFDLALWSGETCLREYVIYYLKMERLYRLFFENKVMRSLINVAPGLNEIAILGKITSGVRKVGPPMNYDLIVVDAYATGHALALFHSPKGLMEAIQFGPMGNHSREMLAVISNPEITGYEVVTLLEEMPVVETLEFCRELEKEVNIVPEVIANKVLQLPVSEDQLKELEASGPNDLHEFAKYLLAVSRRQSQFFSQIKAVSEQLLSIPLIFSARADDLVNRAAEALRKI